MLNALWLYGVLMAAVMAVAALPALRTLDGAGGGTGRVSTIDGLRGFLALGVFVFHLALMPRFDATGVWAPPDSRFLAFLGPVGVSVFFMLTGFLFWSRLLETRGRPGWRRLYIGRLFRIAPMYLFVVLAMLVIVFARTGFTLRESGAAVWSAVLQWLALGLVDTQPDVNGVTARHVLASVTWTLWYEWVFYASLIAWAGVARRRGHLGVVIAALLACLAAKHVWHVDALGFAALFAIGMVVASLRHAGGPPRLAGRMGSVIAVLGLVGAFASPGQGYGTGTALFLGVFFHAVCSGATLFGLLGTRAAQRLGTISYSLYLMQGLVLTLAFSIAPLARFASSSPLGYGAVGLVCATALVLASAAGYRWIERPGIALGQRVARRGGRPAPSSSTAAASSSP